MDGTLSDTNIGKRLNTYFQKPQKSFASTNHTLSTTASQQSEKILASGKKSDSWCNASDINTRVLILFLPLSTSTAAP